MTSPTQCRRCSDCPDGPHHALPNSDYGRDDVPEELGDADYVCKHCPALGDECSACFGECEDFNGEPCGECDGLGVIWRGA